MPVSFKDKLVIAISSRALFDLTESHSVFEAEGLAAYQQYQIDNEDNTLEPGDAFRLVQKLLRLNERLDESKVEVILLSRNSSDTGLRVFNSIEHWGLPISRAAFTGGGSPYKYVSAFGAHLFLSTSPDDVKHALDRGFAAASILPGAASTEGDEGVAGKTQPDDALKIAFDGDAVLFSDEAERVFKSEGLDAFATSERSAAKKPLQGGPFKPFLSSLHRLQSEFPDNDCPIRTALVTARAAPAHERVVRTLREWGIRIDESLFLGGLEKVGFLRAFGADVFFDDHESHCLSASRHVATGHVPHGIANEMK